MDYRQEQLALIHQTLDKFSPISLDEMSAVKLMNRIDTKYVVPLQQLVSLLELAAPLYSVQTSADGHRTAAYHTVYLDTPLKRMYNLHQAGRKVRQKIRVRTYLDTDTTFLEVKTKNNHGRTGKKRITLPWATAFDDALQALRFDGFSHLPQIDEAISFLDRKAWYRLEQLQPHVENRFDRITLVNHAKTERLTIDLNLAFSNYDNGQQADLGHVAIIELKRDGLTFSPMRDILLRMHIHTGGFSKYCVGCAITNPQLRHNNFKEKIHRIEKMKTDGPL